MSGLVAQVLPTVSREAGGPSVSVRRLMESVRQARAGFECRAFAGCGAQDQASEEWVASHPVLVPIRGPARLAWMPGLGAAIVAAKPQLIHVHGLWQGHAIGAQRAARRLGVPLVISPRGMLEPWALQRGRMKKSLMGWIFQRRMLAEAACIVGTSEAETLNVQRTGLRGRMATIPNGIDPVPDEALAFRATGEGSARRTAVFVSRIHPKKGLIDLVDAWSQVRPAGWRLSIVGPDEDGHGAAVRAAIGRHQLEREVELTGPLWGAAKAQALASAALFVLPSYSENFGLVIGEALAAGLPVITTQATPWQEIAEENCGWWIEAGATALASALRAATSLPNSELARMGERGRSLITRRYSWASVAQAYLRLYTELAEPGSAATQPA